MPTQIEQQPGSTSENYGGGLPSPNRRPSRNSGFYQHYKEPSEQY